MGRIYLIWGVVFSGLSVALGAFGAHILRDRVSEAGLEVFRTGVQYQSYHGLALLLLGGWMWFRGESARLKRAAGLFLAGILVFSGSLYGLALTGVKVLGAITPIGGICFLTGWTILLVEAVSLREYSRS